MFQVKDIYEEARKIVGSCAAPIFYRWVTDAVNLIANKGEFEGWKGFLDIYSTTTDGSLTSVTLPREVECPLAVNVGGKPAIARDQLFSFHLNGPGDFNKTCDWWWQDSGGFHSVYQDIRQPAKVVAYLQTPEDNGKRLIVHGYDSNGNKLRHQSGGEWRDGYPVPTIYGYAVPDASAPVIGRISYVQKDVTAGPVRLSTIDDSGLTGQLLGVYEPDEELPQYRRINLARPFKCIRLAYRKTTPTVSSYYDRIPLKSRLGFLLAVRACKAYQEIDLANAHAFEADAVRLELEAQQSSEPSIAFPIQVDDRNQIADKTDIEIS